MIKRISFILVFFSFLASAQVHPLSEFDGTTPVKGLLGENMSSSFFGSRFVQWNHIYTFNYGAEFQFSCSNQQMVGYFVNNEGYANSIVVSAIKNDGTPKNALITVPAHSEIAVDLSSYCGLSQLGVYSLMDFELITSLPVTQNSQQVNQLSIRLPLPIPIDQGPGCSTLNYGKRATLTAALAVLNPGSERVVYVSTRYWPDAGIFGFIIDYPIFGHAAVNAVPQYATCAGEDYGSARSQAQRVYGAKGIVHFDETNQASLTCQSALTPGDSCVPAGLNRAPRYDLRPID